MPTLDRPHGSLHYIIEGPEAAPATVVLIHGLCCELADWSAQVAALAPRYRVLACDLRGFGASRFDAGFDIHTFGTDVVALLESLDIGRALLVGHSMGCRVILQAANLAPRRVDGLVLIDGSRFAADDPQRAVENANAFIKSNGGWNSTVRRLFAGMFNAGSDPEYAAMMIERAARVPEEVGAQVFASMTVWDCTELTRILDALDTQVMVVQSTYVNEAKERLSVEPGSTNPWLDLVREHQPDARIELITGVGHFTQVEAADAVNALIEQMISSTLTP